MCGVFGFVSYNGQGPNLKRLEMLAKSTMKRGPHAFGFAWVDHSNRLRMFKQTGRIVDHLGILKLASDAKLFIGHCRYATHGSPADNINNHPHPADGGWIIHNGVVREYESIVEGRGLQPVTSCDSEALALMIDTGDGTLLERCASAALAAGSGPLVMCGLWSRPNRLVLVRNGNPLSLGRCEGPRYYFASLAESLPGDVEEFADGTAMEFGDKKVLRSSVALEDVVA